MDHESQPTWLAWAAARAADAEGTPDFKRARELVARWMEWASVLLLCDRYDRQAELDLKLEEAMRLAMTRPMDFEGWRAVFEALVDGPRAEAVLGLDPRADLGAAHPVADAIWSATGDFEVPVDAVHLVRAVADPDNFRDDAAPAIVRAAIALIEANPAATSFQLVQVVGVEGHADGTFSIRHRRFAGTAWPAPVDVTITGAPRFTPGELLFWDGGERRVRVPGWLLQVDADSLELSLYDGRDPATRKWRYRSARPGTEVTHVAQIAGEAPVILAEPTWRTPAPASRRATPQPATLASRATQAGADPRPLPASSAAPVAVQEAAAAALEAAATQVPAASVQRGPEHGPARYLLTVLGGRSYLRFRELSDEDSVVIGRNPAFASFVIHDGQISRSNTRVWTTAAGDLYVQDLRSTNGTQLNDKPVGNAPERVEVGDVISVGPVPVGVSWWSEDEASQLRRLIAGPDAPGRDPLTGLYTPAWLADGGARALGGGFVSEARPTALFLVIDRLGALHAQQGADVGDTVFQNVARALMSRLPAPGAAVRVGYGEVLALIPEGGHDAAVALGAEMLEWAEQHRWHGTEGVTLTGSVVHKRPGWSNDAWIAEGRRLVAEGRNDRGRGLIYSPRS